MVHSNFQEVRIPSVFALSGEKRWPAATFRAEKEIVGLVSTGERKTGQKSIFEVRSIRNGIEWKAAGTWLAASATGSKPKRLNRINSKGKSTNIISPTLLPYSYCIDYRATQYRSKELRSLEHLSNLRKLARRKHWQINKYLHPVPVGLFHLD